MTTLIEKLRDWQGRAATEADRQLAAEAIAEIEELQRVVFCSKRVAAGMIDALDSAQKDVLRAWQIIDRLHEEVAGLRAKVDATKEVA